MHNKWGCCFSVSTLASAVTEGPISYFVLTCQCSFPPLNIWSPRFLRCANSVENKTQGKFFDEDKVFIHSAYPLLNNPDWRPPMSCQFREECRKKRKSIINTSCCTVMTQGWVGCLLVRHACCLPVQDSSTPNCCPTAVFLPVWRLWSETACFALTKGWGHAVLAHAVIPHSAGPLRLRAVWATSPKHDFFFLLSVFWWLCVTFGKKKAQKLRDAECAEPHKLVL